MLFFVVIREKQLVMGKGLSEIRRPVPETLPVRGHIVRPINSCRKLKIEGSIGRCPWEEPPLEKRQARKLLLALPV